MAEVEIIHSCLVPISSSHSNSFHRLELTPWDIRLLQLDPIQKGILFTNPNPTPESPITFINHLRNTLSRTLDYFPPLAGRLGSIIHGDYTTSFFIDCNNAGAEFTHAVANSLSVSDIVEPKYIPDIISSLFPLNGVVNFDGVMKPLLGVQVTQLVDGLFIGCTGNHLVLDGTSFWHFINSWAELSRGLGMISKLPIFQRCFPGTCLGGSSSIPLPPLKQYELDDSALPPLLQRFFHFSKGSVAKLKAKANLEAGTDKISSFQALTAHLWQSVVRSRHWQRIGEESRKAEQVSLSLVVGARARFPLPDGYFGNAFFVDKSFASENEILENSLGYVAKLIHEVVGKHSRESGMKFFEDWIKNPTMMGRFTGSGFHISSSPRYNVYGSDFGWGKPVTVRSGKAQKFDGKMTFFPAPEPGGIDVEVCLAPETIKVMEDDPDFLEAFTI